MKQIFLASLLLFISNISLAEWVNVTSSTDDDSTVFISSESIKISGNYRTAWEVMNHAKVLSDGSMSAKVQQEYDCTRNKVRMLNASLHTQHIGNGTTILIAPNTPTKWQDIPKNSIATHTKKYVCGK